VSHPRIFTVQEAERTLPLVRRIVGDLLAAHAVWRETMTRYEMLSGSARADEGESAELLATQQRVLREAERIDACQRELERVGCLFKGSDAGLVDFYALRDDRLVFLCWSIEEAHIAHWHEVDAGFSGRQPIDQAMLSETVTG
jgi:hypothetical protein